jgi:hypothetical protein
LELLIWKFGGEIPQIWDTDLEEYVFSAAATISLFGEAP